MNKLPINFKIKPWSHQLATIKACMKRDYFGLFYEMGGGKTSTTINILRCKFAKHDAPLMTLIICPVIVKENWKREFKMHSHLEPYVQVLSGSGATRIKQLQTSGKFIFITNTESVSMSTLWEAISKMNFQVLIVDESHRFKNPKAKRTKALIKFSDQHQLKYKFILTGSPILNSAQDIWSQMRILSPDWCGALSKNFWAWNSTFFYDANANKPAHVNWPDWRMRPGSEEKLNELIYNHAHRVMKKDVLDLPPITYQTVDVPLSAEQKRLYKEMKNDFIAFLDHMELVKKEQESYNEVALCDDDLRRYSATTYAGGVLKESRVSVANLAITKALRLQQLISGIFVSDEKDKKGKYKTHAIDNKRNEVLADLLEDIPKGAKVIIWCVFKASYKQIEEVVIKSGRIPVFLTGEQNYEEKNSAVDLFNNEPSIDCIIANPNAGGTGVNLTAATYMVYYSRNFSLEADIQSEARCHRGGQAYRVTRIDLVAPNTIDEEVVKALRAKENLAGRILKLRDRL